MRITVIILEADPETPGDSARRRKLERDRARYLDRQDVARRLGSDPATVRKLIGEGRLPEPNRVGNRLGFPRGETLKAIARILAGRQRDKAFDGRLTVEQVAERLGLSPGQVKAWAANGKLPAPTKIGGRLAFDAVKISQWRIRRDRRAAKAKAESSP